MAHSLLHTLGHVVWVARNEGRAAVPLVAQYCRLKVGELLRSARGAAAGRRRTTILGMDVEFFDHYWLVEMFEDIFLRGQYYFESDHERPLIVDIGSNIGLAILYFKRLYPHSRLIAFEPDPEAFAVLERNVAANALSDITLVNAAVVESGDTVDLYRDDATPGSPQMTTSSGRGGGAATAVPAARLSDHLSGPVDFLKLDAEGAEHGIIRELDRSGRLELVERMAIEYHHHLESARDGMSELLAALERHGFGYQLEARMDGPPGARAGYYQNVLVSAYRSRAAGEAAGTGG